MKTLALGILSALALCAGTMARAVTLRVESRIVAAGDAYDVRLTVANATNLAGLLLNITYNPALNALTGAPLVAGAAPPARLRTQAVAYPSTAGSLKVGWLKAPAVSTSGDSVLTLRLRAIGASGSRDTIRVSVLEAVNAAGQTVAMTVQPGAVYMGNQSGVPFEAAPGRLTLTARPDPIRGGAALQLTIPDRMNIRLDLYDLAGRLVRRLLDGPVQPGQIELPWDGRHDSGKSLPAGLYFARAAGAGRFVAAKVLLLK